MKVDSEPEDDCPALLGVAVLRSSSTTAVACILLVLLVFMHIVSFLRLSAARGGRSLPLVVRRSVHEFHLKFVQYIDEPLPFGRHFSPSRRSLSTDFF